MKKKFELTTGRVIGKVVPVLVLENRAGESTVLNMESGRLATIKNDIKAKKVKVAPVVVAPVAIVDAATLPTS